MLPSNVLRLSTRCRMAWRAAFLIGSVEAAGSEQEREGLRRAIKDASEVVSLAAGIEDDVVES